MPNSKEGQRSEDDVWFGWGCKEIRTFNWNIFFTLIAHSAITI